MYAEYYIVNEIKLYMLIAHGLTFSSTYFPFQYPMAVVGTAGRGIIIYTLDGQPKEYKRDTSPLKYQHRCISIFKDKKAQPTGN